MTDSPEVEESTTEPEAAGRWFEVNAKPQEGFGGGFQVPWVAGTSTDGDKTEFTLTTGAGTGNPFLTMRVEFANGDTVTENIDIRVLLRSWLAQVVADQYHRDSVSVTLTQTEAPNGDA